MARTHATNEHGIKPGDVITFTNDVNYNVKIIVAKVDTKSWYDEHGARRSYGTLNSWSKYVTFKIDRI